MCRYKSADILLHKEDQQNSSVMQGIILISCNIVRDVCNIYDGTFIYNIFCVFVCACMYNAVYINLDKQK